MTNYQEFLIILYKLCYIFTEQRERGIGDNYIGFFKKLYALFGAKIAVTFEW